MAKLRLTKKGLILLVACLSIFSAVLGFGVWKLTGFQDLAPVDSQAGCKGNCGVVYDQTGGTTQSCNTCGTAQTSQGCTEWCNAYQNKIDKNREGRTLRRCICLGTGTNNCGRNCVFPVGTKEKCQALSDLNCKTYIAMCNSRGQVSCEVFNENHKCWGHESECKNPVTTGTCNPTNQCDTGGIVAPANSTSYNVGDVVNIRGWAADADGINKGTVEVSIDGVVVGNATAHDVDCTATPTHFACLHGNTTYKSIWWEYNYTVTKTGAIAISVVWEDNLGNGGASCKANRSIVGNVQGNPDWEIAKTGASVCLVQTAGSQKARVDYTITIRNVGDLAGQLTTLVDKLDNKVQTSYIKSSSIDPDGTVSGNKITWDLSGALGEFSPNEEKEFRYSIVVPQVAFGQYTNTATATPDSGDTFKAIEVVYASCSAPETGLFDSALAKILLGMILVGASGAYLYSDKGLLTLGRIVKTKKRTKKETFEERIVAGK